MSLMDTFFVGLVTMFMVELGRASMFDNRLAANLPEWWTRTAEREAIARIGLSLISGGIVLVVLEKLGSDGEIQNSNWWKPCAGIMGAVLVRQIWWAANGKFAQAWQQWKWTAEAKAKNRQE